MYNQPYVKKIEDLKTGLPSWNVLQQVKNDKGETEQRVLGTFSDKHSGESDAFKWIRNNTNVWSANR